MTETRTQRRRRLKLKYHRYKRRRLLLVLLGLSILVLIVSNKIYSAKVDEIEKVAASESVAVQRDFSVSDTVRFNGRFHEAFNDLQEVQIVVAERNGITPLTSADSIETLLAEGKLVPVPECHLYEVSETSLPYLRPDAKALLDVIAVRFQQRDKSDKQLRITGCLRTNESIRKLKRGNINSVTNSCHLYGTTFDISYRYMSYPEKRLLAQILYELQQAGHCYVKYERKQPCFHITLR